MKTWLGSALRTAWCWLVNAEQEEEPPRPLLPREWRLQRRIACMVILRTRLLCLCGCKEKVTAYVHQPFATLAEGNLVFAKCLRDGAEVRLIVERELIARLCDFSVPYLERQADHDRLFDAPQHAFVERN